MNERIYVNFKQAVDQVCEPLGHEDVARAVGVSVQTIRQARLSPNAKAYRAPPERWESALIRLAERRIAQYKRLAENLRRATPVENK